MKVEVGKLYNEVYFCIKTGTSTKFPIFKMWEKDIIFSKSKRGKEGSYELYRCNEKDFFSFHFFKRTFSPVKKVKLLKRNPNILNGGENESQILQIA